MKPLKRSERGYAIRQGKKKAKCRKRLFLKAVSKDKGKSKTQLFAEFFKGVEAVSPSASNSKKKRLFTQRLTKMYKSNESMCC
jgi:hypothetical protein